MQDPTISRSSDMPYELPTMDSDLQEWCTTLLNFIDRDDLEIAAPSGDSPGDHDADRSWMTNTAESLPRLSDLSVQEPATSSPLHRRTTIKQRHRNVTAFALPEASLADSVADSADDTNETHFSFGSPVEDFALPSSNTLVTGTSGGYRNEPQAAGSGRTPPNHHPDTLKILEGNGPFVLDARDISRSQFHPGHYDTEDTTTLGSSTRLQMMLQRNVVGGSAAERQVHPWTSGVFNDLGEGIVWYLDNMGDATASAEGEGLPSLADTQRGSGTESGHTAGHLEAWSDGEILSLRDGVEGAPHADEGEDVPSRADAPSGHDVERDHVVEDLEDLSSSSMVTPPPSLIIPPVRASSKKKRFGRFGRWLKRIVTR
ncbi:hypothetical protein SLS60_005984 [Paraconiothyrium brasiliense]|uniref:Uncharacterized protein n=1 Tax=Paraconiothyrium brasiliense TaxID=300254 RepID=A0ABR3RE61_9PLEO